jgi:hypothetical protein
MVGPAQQAGIIPGASLRAVGFRLAEVGQAVDTPCASRGEMDRAGTRWSQPWRESSTSLP